MEDPGIYIYTYTDVYSIDIYRLYIYIYIHTMGIQVDTMGIQVDIMGHTII